MEILRRSDLTDLYRILYYEEPLKDPSITLEYFTKTDDTYNHFFYIHSALQNISADHSFLFGNDLEQVSCVHRN